jgi:hypothetical protein
MFENLQITVEYWDIERLLPYLKNPRKNDHAVDRAAKIIQTVGFRIPILAKSDGLIIDGHLRLKVAKKLGMKKVPVSSCDGMTEAEIKALRLSVNQMADLADWDLDLLDEELADLELAGINKEDLGFEDIMPDNEDWNSDIEEPKGDKNLDGIEATIRVTCSQEKKDEVMVFIKRKLLEAAFEDVHVT